MFSYENPGYARYRIQLFAMAEEGLSYLGIGTEDGVEYVFERKDETLDACKYMKDEFTQLGESSSSEKEDSFVSYEINEQRNVGILTLDECNMNDEYSECVKSLFIDVKMKSIENVVVDLRENSGGNSEVALEFIRYLNVDTYDTGSVSLRFGPFVTSARAHSNQNPKVSNLTFDGNLYILTSAKTCSSAVLFAEYITDNGLGEIVGESPANASSAYGDIVQFQAPHSKLYFAISSKKFGRSEKAGSDKYVMPDVECKANQAMEKTLELITGK